MTDPSHELRMATGQFQMAVNEMLEDDDMAAICADFKDISWQVARDLEACGFRSDSAASLMFGILATAFEMGPRDS